MPAVLVTGPTATQNLLFLLQRLPKPSLPTEGWPGWVAWINTVMEDLPNVTN